MLVAGGAANSVIIFHAESVKVPVNCTLTSASELEAALPKELLPISALGKRIHHCRPRETAKSFPELPAAKSPCSPLFLSFLSLFSCIRRGSEGRCQIVSVLWGWQEQVGSCSGGQHRVSLGLCPHSSQAVLWPLTLALQHQLGVGDVPKVLAGTSRGQFCPWGPSAFGLLWGLVRGSVLNPLLSALCWLHSVFSSSPPGWTGSSSGFETASYLVCCARDIPCPSKSRGIPPRLGFRESC